MALINCPECKKEISDQAKSCPQCGFEPIDSKTVHTEVKKTKSAADGFKSLAIAFGIIFILFYLVRSCDDEKSNSSNSSYTPNKFLAYTYAEDFVKQKLKSPSTAEFPGTLEKADHITELGNKKYRITSWVDSQNSFGATIRTKFSCVIEFEGNKVSCEKLIINN